MSKEFIDLAKIEPFAKRSSVIMVLEVSVFRARSSGKVAEVVESGES